MPEPQRRRDGRKAENEAHTPLAAQTFDFTNPEAQCTVEVLTEETASTVANSPMGKQGYQVLYVKDPKELFRSKDKLSCQAMVV